MSTQTDIVIKLEGGKDVLKRISQNPVKSFIKENIYIHVCVKLCIYSKTKPRICT